MADDDLDLELDLDSEPEPPAKARPAGRSAPERVAAPASPGDGSGAPAAKPAVMPARRPGVVARITAPVAGLCHRVHLPPWNLRTFGIGGVVLLLVLVFVENWPPMRLSLIGLHADVPKAVALAVAFILGFLVAWLVLRRGGAEEPAGE